MIDSIGKSPIVANVNDNQVRKVNEKNVKTEKVQNNKVQEVYQALKNGKYQIDLQATSEKMALNLLNI